MNYYIDEPCPCEYGAHCPHYCMHLSGRIWELSRTSRAYRGHWAARCHGLPLPSPDKVFRHTHNGVLVTDENGKYKPEHVEELKKIGVLAEQMGLPVDASPDPAFGPGTELTKILASLGLHEGVGCKCKARAKQMDLWGVEGCEQHRDEITGWLRQEAEKRKWDLVTAWKAVTTGLFLKFSPFDPIPGLVDEAIARARMRRTQSSIARTTSVTSF